VDGLPLPSSELTSTETTAVPSGTYEGTVTVLSETIEIKVVIFDNNTASMSGSLPEALGSLDLECNDQPFTLNTDGYITLTDAEKEGSCIQQTLDEAQDLSGIPLSLDSIQWRNEEEQHHLEVAMTATVFFPIAVSVTLHPVP